MGSKPASMSERTRSHLRTGIMLVLLAATLGAASLVADHRQQWRKRHDPAMDLDPQLPPARVGDLQFPVPAGWKVVAPAPRESMVPGTIVWEGPVPASGRLLAAQLPHTVPMSPPQALQQAMQWLIPEDQVASLNFLDKRRIRSGSRLILRTVASVGDRGTAAILQTVVFTEDGRHYGVLHLAQPLRSGRVRLEPTLVHMAQQAVDGRLRNAAPDDLPPRGLPVPTSLGGVSMIGSRVTVASPGEPLTISPIDGGPHLRIARLRGTIAVDAGEEDDPLSIPSLMAAMAARTGRDDSSRDRVWSGRLPLPGSGDELPAWRVRFPRDAGPYQRFSLVRDVFYIRTGEPGLALLVELLFEDEAEDDSAAWAASIAAWATDQIEAGSHRRRYGDIGSARKRGEDLSAAWREHLEEAYSQGRGVYLIQRASRPFGFQIDEVTVHGQRVRGRSLVVLLASPYVEIQHRWEARPQGQGFSLMSHQHGAGPATASALQLDRGVLSMSATEEQWSMAVPAGYIWPVAQDRWPIGSMKGLEGRPALVWVSPYRQRPSPYWLEAVEAGGEVRMRPLLAMESDRLELGEQGQVVSLLGWDRSASGAGATPVMMKEITRAELSDLFPDLQESIDAWESAPAAAGGPADQAGEPRSTPEQRSINRTPRESP